MGLEDFDKIMAQLQRDPNTHLITEKIQIYTHSRGGAFGVGFTEALLEKIKQYRDQFDDPAHVIDFVFNMAPNQSAGGAFSAPPGVDEYSDHHDHDNLSSNDMKGVIAAFSSRQYVLGGGMGATQNSFI